MRSFQAVLAIIMAAMANMVLGAAGTHAIAAMMAGTLIDTVTSSGFQHSVVATPRTAKSIDPYLDICFDNSTILHAAGNNSPLVPWLTLQAISNDTEKPHWQLYEMFESICKEISKGFLSNDIPYTTCRPYTNANGTYSVMAQLTYRDPHWTVDMRKHHKTCMGLMFMTLECPYGGLFRDVEYSYGLPKNTSQWWTVQARPVQAACPDCTAGLLPTFADQN